MTGGEKIRCDACPVMCYIADGRTGACDRYGNQGGKIVNIASVSGVRPSPGTAVYGAAKAGLLSLTESLAMEWVRAYIPLLDRLAERLSSDPKFLESAASLAAYERRRRPEAMARLLGIDALNRTSMISARPLRDLRAATLGGLYAIAPLRRVMMRAGLGVS